MIELKHVSKTYGTKKALKDLSLTIQQGEIFGFLGHNGAGKSTTIKSLVSILQPTSGEIVFDGKALAQYREEIKKQIAYVPDSPDMFLQLTAGEYWDLIAAAYEVPETQKKVRLNELGQLFDMTTHAEETLASFSHGMRQKTILIGALLPDPDIWILDEPLQGLDPQAAFDLKEMMKAHAAKCFITVLSMNCLHKIQIFLWKRSI